MVTNLFGGKKTWNKFDLIPLIIRKLIMNCLFFVPFVIRKGCTAMKKERFYNNLCPHFLIYLTRLKEPNFYLRHNIPPKNG